MLTYHSPGHGHCIESRSIRFMGSAARLTNARTFEHLAPFFLSEVLSGLGIMERRLEGLLPDIIANSRCPHPTVQEGFMYLLVFLPATFGNCFQSIAPNLEGLSTQKNTFEKQLCVLDEWWRRTTPRRLLTRCCPSLRIGCLILIDVSELVLCHSLSDICTHKLNICPQQ